MFVPQSWDKVCKRADLAGCIEPYQTVTLWNHCNDVVKLAGRGYFGVYIAGGIDECGISFYSRCIEQGSQ